MIWINAILSTLLVFGLIAAALGYRHSVIRREYSPEWYFSLSKILIAVAFGMRLLFWDAFWGPLRLSDPAAALALSDAVGGVSGNVLSSIVGLAGVYASLKARQLLLREEEQKHWPWIIAWAHPRFLGFPRRR